MELHNNTLLITGAGSGIGRGLAHAFADLGNHVVVAGRRRKALEETARGRANIDPFVLDVGDAEAIRRAAPELTARFPKLNVVIHNAGIMRAEDLAAQAPDVAVAEATVAINLLGPIRLNTALLPHLRRQARATIVTASSGLAFVPLAPTPTYCASKAAIHSYTDSLRRQLAPCGIEVLEIIPPYVATELMDGKDDPQAMPLADFLRQTMERFAERPTPLEIAVPRVQFLRAAEREGRYAATFATLNQAREQRRDEITRK